MERSLSNYHMFQMLSEYIAHIRYRKKNYFFAYLGALSERIFRYNFFSQRMRVNHMYDVCIETSTRMSQ